MSFVPSNRITHLADIFHRAEMSNGTSVPSNWGLFATGSNFGMGWAPQSAGGAGVSYGSNAMDVTSADNGGASTDVSRMDHRHRGVRQISAASSNTLVGDLNFIGQGSVGVTVSGQTVQFSGPGSSGGGGGAAGDGSLAAGVYGNGSDGDVTFTVDSQLLPQRDFYYNNLTINAGVTVTTNAVRVFVKGTLTLEGMLSLDGVNGGNGGNGTVAAGGGQGSAGGGGITGNVGPATVGLAGHAGAFNGVPAGNGTSTASGMGIQHSNGAAGGSSNVNAGGAGTIAAAAVTTANEKPFTYPMCVTIVGMTGVGIGRSGMWGTTPGGGGGGGGSAAGGGGGGGGGGSGNVVVVSCRVLTGAGTLRAKGGTGGNGGNGFNGTGGAGGGGGGNGGAGGYVSLVYGSRAGWTGTVDVSGGAGGTGGTGTGTGTNGGNGATGPTGHQTQYQMG